MSNRIFVVESDPAAFAQWNNQTYGLQAELAAARQGGIEAEVEQIATAADLFALAAEIRADGPLPGRAVVFTGTRGSDLDRDPMYRWAPGERPADYKGPDTIEQPPDYDEERGPKWAWKGDRGRPLSPYGRLLAARIVRKMVPSIRLEPGIDEPDEFMGRGYFLWEYGSGGYDELVAQHGTILAAVNRHALATGKAHMSLVDAVGEPAGRDGPVRIEGTDVDARHSYSMGVASEIWTYPDRPSHMTPVHYIGVAARLLANIDPAITGADNELVVPRLSDETA